MVYSAVDGSLFSRVGSSGREPGRFERPNGIFVIDDLVMVVERDNQRIQVLKLPDFTPLGLFTHEDIRLPYGITADRAAGAINRYDVFTSDN
ncbi:MAG: hypothetical protein R3281_01640 [Balneolaceae bacterium]|nr:hypothetical protein [Balneolaceae bacterium]